MDSRQWLDPWARELRRRGLPPEYIERYVAELSDHLTDLIEDRRSAMSKDALNVTEITQRMGAPATLADAAVREFSQRTFWGRHPILTFVLAPIPLAVLAWAATFAAVIAVGAGISQIAVWLGTTEADSPLATWPAPAVWGIPILFVLAVTVPPALLAVQLCRVAHGNGLSWRWSLAGCLLVALVAGLFQATLDLPVVPGEGRLMLGFGVSASPPARQVLQFALPLMIGLGLLWRQVHTANHRPHSALAGMHDAQERVPGSHAPWR